MRTRAWLLRRAPLPSTAVRALGRAALSHTHMGTRLTFCLLLPNTQAILLDILLVLPRLVETVLSPPRSGFGLELYAHSQSFVWIFITTWVVFAVASCVMGHWARIPYIADSADAQVR